MFKLLNFVIILLLLLTSYAYAQPIFDQPATPKPGQPSSSSMSPSEFLNAVGKMSQQTNSDLSQQAKQLYPKPQPQPGANGPNLPAQQPEGQQATTPATVDNSFSVGGSGSPTPAQPEAAAPAPTTAAPAPTTPAAPGQQPSGNYSGFGTGKSNKPNTPAPPASSGNSGGWNINY